MKPSISRSASFIPSAGDLVWLDFSPTEGRGQFGDRSAVVVSRHEFSLRTRMAFVCPITSTVRRLPTSVQIPRREAILAAGRTPIHGEILVDQLRSVDIARRHFRSADERLEPALLDEVLARMEAILPF